jgi:hypothetical protein
LGREDARQFLCEHPELTSRLRTQLTSDRRRKGGGMMLLGGAIIITILALFLGDSVLASISDQLERRRAYRLELEREETRRVELQQSRDAIIWRQLQPEDSQRIDQDQP